MPRARHLTARGKPLSLFERFAGRATAMAGRSVAFALALLTIIVWGITGPLFGFSEVWQLVINTGTTIVTFLMVFLIQHQQNKDSIALHLKLNELIASHQEASNRMVKIEDLSDDELEVLEKFYARLAQLAAREHGVKTTHSLDEADQRHAHKHGKRAAARRGRARESEHS
jgi:low affinity Fe/Cu permease